MKTILTSIASAVVAVILFASLLSFDHKNEDNNDGVPTGTVIYSIIPPTQFLQANKGWAKLDGDAIDQNSELYHMIQETGILSHLNGKFPNASGMFIRDMNYDATGVDPNKSRDVGGFEEDAFKAHRHDHKHFITLSGTTTSDTHVHNYDDRYTSVSWNPWVVDNAGFAEGNSHISYSEITKSDPNVFRSSTTGKYTHKHQFSWSGSTDVSGATVGDVETRPKNIALYVYIKVN